VNETANTDKWHNAFHFSLVLIVYGACSIVSCSLDMSCSLRRFVHGLQLAPMSLCLIAVVIIILLYWAVVFMSISNTGHVSRKETTLLEHIHRVVVGHYNCSSGSIYCSDNLSQVESSTPHNVYVKQHTSTTQVFQAYHNVDHIYATQVTSVSVHNGSLVHSVPLVRLTTEAVGSLKHYTGTVPGVSQSHNVRKALFWSRKLVLWSSDHHPAPAYDTRHLLEPLGVRFLQHDLSPYCSFFNLCAERNSLKVSHSIIILNVVIINIFV